MPIKLEDLFQIDHIIKGIKNKITCKFTFRVNADVNLKLLNVIQNKME